MKNLFLLSAIALSVFFVSCDDDDQVTTEVIDSSMPSGTFTASTSGSIVGQNDTGTTGMVTLGTDEEGTQFMRLGSGFTTNLGTGTVTVFLSTSDTFTADPMNGNPDLRLIGSISKNGEQYFKVSPQAESKFTHVIFWCASANIPFGYAQFN